MRTAIFLPLIFLFFPLLVFSQIPYQIALGGPGGEWPNVIIETYDGGFVSSGSTDSYGVGTDMYVVKTDSAGNILWTRTFGGTGFDVALRGLQQTTDSGIIVGGYTNSYGTGGYDYLFLRLDKQGNMIWAKTVGGATNDFGNDVIQTSDGGYCMTGHTNSFGAGGSDVYVVKLDAAGNLQWTRTVGGPLADYSISIVQSPDGGYAITGHTYSYGAGMADGYVIKLNSLGVLLWTKVIGGIDDENPRTIINTLDNGFAINGWTYSYGSGINEMHVMKFDALGNLQWTQVIGGTGIEYGWDIIQLPDSAYVLCGYTSSHGAGNDAWFLKLNKTGNLLGSSTFGTGAIAVGVIRTSNNKYAIIGYTSAYGAGSVDFYQAILDSNGTTCQETGSGAVFSQGGTVTTGGISGSGGVLGVCTPTVGSGGIMTPFCPLLGTESFSETKINLFPNPSSGKTTFQFSNPKQEAHQLMLFDSRGVCVRKITKIVSSEFILEREELSAGLYFFRLSNGSGIVASGKLILE